MARNLRAKKDFSGGAVTQKLYSQVDLPKYKSGLRLAENAQVLPQGPVRRRNGSQFISEVNDSTQPTILIPFKFSSNDTMMLEFSNLSLRFYLNDALVLSSGTPYVITTNYTGTEVSKIGYIQNGNTVYLTHPSHQPKVLVRLGVANWTLSDYTPAAPATDQLGFSPVASITPGATSGTGITFTCSVANYFLPGDVGRNIVNLSGTGVALITAVPGTSSTTCTANITQNFPSTSAITSTNWLLDTSPTGSITPSGTVTFGGAATITSAVNTFRSTDIGSYILVNAGMVYITGYTSALVVTGIVVKSLTAVATSTIWTMEMPTWTATRGYPRAVGFFQQRLAFGGTIASPSTFWLSAVGSYGDLRSGANANDAISEDLVKGEIEWFVSSDSLFVGTSDGEISISSSTGVVSPTTISRTLETACGSKIQTAFTVGPDTLFVQRSGQKIRAMTYDFRVGKYREEELTLSADHYLRGTGSTIVQLIYCKEPDSMLYAVLSDGSLLCGTYNKVLDLMGWTRYTTLGRYEALATIPNNNIDEVWVVVNRTINGVTRRYVEVFNNGDGSGLLDGYSDCYFTYSGAATTTLSGLSNLNGQTVQVKVNGAWHPDCLVSAGSIYLSVPATTATVGLAYTTIIQTLDDEFNVGQGTMIGQKVQWVEPLLRMYNSMLPTVNNQINGQRLAGGIMGAPIPIYTGDAQYNGIHSPTLIITENRPFPLNISGIFGIMEGNF